MGKRIPIDDLFRDGLSQGKEPMNLGAWANMERMLNGENPYQKDEKKKRPLVPFIIAFSLLTGLLSASYLLLKDSNSKKEFSTHPITNSALSESTSPTPTNSVSSLSSTQNSLNTKNTIPNTKKKNINFTSSSSKSSTQTTMTASALPTNNSVASDEESSMTTLNKQVSVTNSSEPGNLPLTNVAESIAPKMDLVNSKTIPNNPKRNRHSELSTLQKTYDNYIPSINVPSSTMMNSIAEGAESVSQPLAKEPSRKVEMTEKSFRRRGQHMAIEFDTVSIENSLSSVWQPTADAQGKYHPRYVVLSETEHSHIALQASTANNKESENIITDNIAESKSITNTPLLQSKKPEDNLKKKITDQRASLLREKFAALGASWMNVSGPSCPGMTMGVNAAYRNPSNNFGGFQAGINNLKPFGDYFSLLAELKFFIRNNSGYSVRDIMTANKNLSKDVVSLANNNQSIYSYQIDSTVRLYNFNNFMSLELPIVLQGHYRRMTVYGGVNLAYMLPIRTKEVLRNYVLNKSDTLANSQLFSLPAEQGRDFVKTDFAGRWGIGYVAGVSYSFNPQMYVDLRMARQLNDNARTLAAREVSANTFKVPTVQLSLGYRFKKFIPGP